MPTGHAVIGEVVTVIRAIDVNELRRAVGRLDQPE